MIDEGLQRKVHPPIPLCNFKYLKYQPKIIQTDNGFEFTHFRETKQFHPLDLLCQELGIEHKLIRPRTPRHNGKVERSHPNDNRRFYQHLQFYSYNDLIKQMKAYLCLSNQLSMQTLQWSSPTDIKKSIQGASPLYRITHHDSIFEIFGLTSLTMVQNWRETTVKQSLQSVDKYSSS